MSTSPPSKRGTIEGTPPTEIIVTAHSDRLFVLLTQSGRMGTMIHVEKDVRLSGGGHDSAADDGSDAHGPQRSTFSIRTLLGKRDQPIYEVYGRQIAQQLDLDRPLLLSVSLDSHSPELLKQVIALLSGELKCW